MPLLQLCIVLVFPAFALKTAAEEDYQAIAALIAAADRMESELATKDIALLRLRSAVDPDRSRIAALELEIANQERARDVTMTRAIKLTLRAYDVIPHRDDMPETPTGISAYPKTAGERIHFVPVYSPALARKHSVYEHGKSRALPTRPDRSTAYIASNGTVVVHGRVTDPRFLALILHHERIHFDQFLRPGVGSRSRADIELEAYNALLPAMREIGYPADSHEEEEMRKQIYGKIRVLREEAARQNTAARRIGRRLGLAGDGGHVDFDIPTEELTRIRSESRALDQKLREENLARQAPAGAASRPSSSVAAAADAPGLPASVPAPFAGVAAAADAPGLAVLPPAPPADVAAAADANPVLPPPPPNILEKPRPEPAPTLRRRGIYSNDYYLDKR